MMSKKNETLEFIKELKSYLKSKLLDAEIEYENSYVDKRTVKGKLIAYRYIENYIIGKEKLYK